MMVMFGFTVAHISGSDTEAYVELFGEPRLGDTSLLQISFRCPIKSSFISVAKI